MALGKDKARKVRRGVVFCLREQLECKALCTGRGDEQSKSLSIELSGQPASTVLYYGPATDILNRRKKTHMHRS